ncbi:ABC transporter ATP-binding protein [Streptomyces sp. S3(2020)]|uniref:ATP-binding cassette domain-containing protein n=1 Tax=Streptomyces sp. S3(2020) TaxID=2732044 RepID=UPI001488D3FB|nr:ABC transporter ATP-binding protein [Streptomyces sp. S3(2020)]
MSTLDIETATVAFGRNRDAVTAVDDVSLSVPSGTVLGLVGESGSGKSTLARAVAGLQPLTGGRILVDGIDIRDRAHRHGRKVQMVFQDPYTSLNPRMNVGASLAEVVRANGSAGPAGVDHAVAALLDNVRLSTATAAKYPGQLSGGMRQRVAVARALAARPRILIADEITSALDASVQSAVLNLVRDIHRELGLTILFISHNLAVVRYLADATAVMYRGRIVEQGPSHDVITAPRHDYTRRLIGSLPTPGEFGDPSRSPVTHPGP